jgi:hypothetical protein
VPVQSPSFKAEYLSEEFLENSPLKAPENTKKKKRYSDKTRGTPSGSTPNIASSSNTTSTPESNLFTKEIFATAIKNGTFIIHLLYHSCLMDNLQSCFVCVCDAAPESHSDNSFQNLGEESGEANPRWYFLHDSKTVCGNRHQRLIAT